MTDREIRDLVQDCGLDWHRGYMPLFDGDPTNRYAVLVEAAVAAERERWIAKAGQAYTEAHAIFNDPPSKTPQCVRDVIEWHLYTMRHDEIDELD